MNPILKRIARLAGFRQVNEELTENQFVRVGLDELPIVEGARAMKDRVTNEPDRRARNAAFRRDDTQFRG